MALDEISDPELDLGSLINLEETIKSDEKSSAVIISREEEAQIKKSKKVQDYKEVVDEEGIKPAKIKIPTKAIIPATKQSFCDKKKSLVLFWIIFSCSLMSPVHASDKPPLLAPDRCDYHWSTEPEDMQVTPGVDKTFRITYKCPSPVEKIQVVFNLENGSTPINVWSYDGRGNPTYNQVFDGHIQVWYDLKNGMVNVTVKNLIYQGSIGVRIRLPEGQLYIPPQKGGSAVNSTSRPTTRTTMNNEIMDKGTSKVNEHGRKAMISAEPILAILFFILLIWGVVLYIVVQILKPKDDSERCRKALDRDEPITGLTIFSIILAFIFFFGIPYFVFRKKKEKTQIA